MKKGMQRNILFLSTDEHHFQAMSAVGCPYVKTPHMDWLMRNGVAFSKSYSPNPVCGPARACWFSGSTSSENGIINNQKKSGTRADRPKMGTWLERHTDYRRVFAGKWHAGEHPFSYAIDGFDVILSGVNRNGMLSDAAIAAASEAFIRQHDGSQPYLLVTCLQQPHDICESIRMDSQPMRELPYGLEEKDLPPLPENFDYRHKESAAFPKPQNAQWTELNWRYYLWSYYRHVEMVDAQIGNILGALRDTGQIENTLILFTSDHGEALACRRATQKNTAFDESARVPFSLCLPGEIPAFYDEETLVSGLDIMPTILDYAGAPIPPSCSGLSLKPHMDSLISGAPQPPDRPFIVTEVQSNTGRMLRSSQYKYVRYDDDSELLFDMDADPLEMNDLTEDPQHFDTLVRHRAWLREWENARDRHPDLEAFPCK